MKIVTDGWTNKSLAVPYDYLAERQTSGTDFLAAVSAYKPTSSWNSCDNDEAYKHANLLDFEAHETLVYLREEIWQVLVKDNISRKPAELGLTHLLVDRKILNLQIMNALGQGLPPNRLKDTRKVITKLRHKRFDSNKEQ